MRQKYVVKTPILASSYIEPVPEEPAVPVGRLSLLLVPPRDDVGDAHGQRVRGPAEPQSGGAGVDHHDEVALDLLKAPQGARGSARHLPAPRPLKGRARPSAAARPAGRELRPAPLLTAS